MARAMRDWDFPYIRIGNELFIRVFDPDNVLINTNWRIAYSVSLDQMNPPPVLSALIDTVIENIKQNQPPPEKKEQSKMDGRDVMIEIIKQDQPLSEKKKQLGMIRLFGGDCELIRAAAIRIEDMAPDELLRYVPKSPLPSECTPLKMRGWGRECGTVVQGDKVIMPASRWPE
jgi:hypothetical protein